MQTYRVLAASPIVMASLCRAAVAQFSFVPPEWVSLPQISVAAWPETIVLPAPIIVTLTWSAPPDNYAMAPIENGSLCALEAKLFDEQGALIARAYKKPQRGGTRLRSWPIPIKPGKCLQKQAVLLWREVNDSWVKPAAQESGVRRGTLVVRVASVPDHVRERAGTDWRRRFEARLSVQVRRAGPGEELARAVYTERLFHDLLSWNWARVMGDKERARLADLLSRSRKNEIWQLVRGLMLMGDLEILENQVMGKKRPGAVARLSKLRVAIEAFVREFPECPISDNLFYRVGNAVLWAHGTSSFRRRAELIGEVRQRFPAGDIATNAWWMMQYRRFLWPATRPAYAPARQNE